MPSDRRGRLISDPFSYRATKDGRVIVDRGGRTVSTIAGAKAERLMRAIADAEDDDAVQQLLARATGHYRRGGGKDAPGTWRELPHH
jgi:hypothetical protein